MADFLHGVFAAVLTPLDADKSPDHAAMAAHCRWLLDHGCDGLSVLGTTGEANSFTVAERVALLEALARSGIPPRVLMPGTGCCALADTVALCRATLDLGAPGVLVLPPFYYKTVSDEGLFAAFAGIVEQVGENVRNVKAGDHVILVARVEDNPKIPQAARDRKRRRDRRTAPRAAPLSLSRRSRAGAAPAGGRRPPRRCGARPSRAG